MITENMLQKAIEARKGKASPRRPKVTGGRAHLAEISLPGVDEAWWVRRARFLRLDKGHRWSYQRIAEDLDKSYRQVYKALNKERVKATDKAYERRNRAYLSERQKAYRLSRGIVCSVCSKPMLKSKMEKPVCVDCKQAAYEERCEAVKELYCADWKLREIDQHLKLQGGSAGAILTVLRHRGVDLPRRFRAPGTL
jgi:hypothetical protein